jgi:hypothetical protein
VIRIARIALSVAAVAAFAIWVPSGAAAPGGRIHGRVLDRTAPPHAVAGQAVRLTIVERGASSDQEITSRPSGEFEFTGLPVGGIRVFVLSTQYGGVRYTSEQILLTAQVPTRAVDLAVYDSSSSRSAVRAAAALAIVDVARGAVRVSVVQGFLNPTDRAVTISAEDPLIFPLPAGAERPRMLAGWREPHIDAGRIVDSFPLVPGSTRVAYAYELKTSGPQLRFPWLLPYGASELQVLVPDTGITLSAEGLKAQGTLVGPRARYARWSGEARPPGAEVALQLSGLPAARDAWPPAVAAGLGLVLFGGLGLALRR